MSKDYGLSVVKQASIVITALINHPEDRKKVIEEKTYKGKKVRALLVASIRKGSINAAPHQLSDALNELLEGIKRVNPDKAFCDMAYCNQYLKWRDKQKTWGSKETFYPTFKKAWNESEGDANRCSEILGKNDWGETIMSPSDCEKKYKEAIETLPHKHGLCETKAVATKRGGKITDDDLKNAIADLAKLLK